MVHIKKMRVILNKPIYTGFAILDLSKVIIMYDFLYNHIIKELGYENVKLLFTYTDSLCYHITVPKGKQNLYEFMEEYKTKYDTSNFDPKHPDPLLSLCSVKIIVKNWANSSVKLDRSLPRNLSAFELRCIV